MIVDVAEDEVEVMMSRIMRSRRRKMMMLRMIMLRPKGGTHTLCEPAQSKCTSASHKSHFTQEFTRKNAAAQNRGLHFVRACAVEMHINMSQEQFYTGIYRKNAAVQCRGPPFLRACAIELHINMSQEPFYQKFTGKMPRPRTTAQTLCEPARAKRT